MDALELELLKVVSCHVGAENRTRVPEQLNKCS